MLRIGFVGLGAMGMSHLRTVAAICAEEAEVAAVCARDWRKLAEVRQIAPKAERFTDALELIRSPVDAVFISTPNHTHFDLGREVLRLGKHLFLEKPLAITRAHCRKLVSLSQQTTRVTMIGHELRYSPYFQKIKQLIDSGAVGRPRMVWCREFRGPFQKKSNNWIEDARCSGGTLIEKNCHHFDLMNWWIGSKPRRVCAFGGNAVNRVIRGPHQVHDHATVSFEYENGTRGTLQLSLFALDFPREDLEMGVVGDEGLLQTRMSKVEILQWRRNLEQKEPIVHRVAAQPGMGWGRHLGSDEMHREFIRCIVENRRPATAPQECVDGTLLGIAAEESIRRGRVISMRQD